MIDLRYHIATLVGIFLALGLGILIGSTMVGNDVIVDQQKKMIDRLEEQFYTLRDKENTLVAENQSAMKLIDNYENFSQSMLPAIVSNSLADSRIAVVVTGTEDIPAAMSNTFAVAGATVASKTVILPNINLNDNNVRNSLIKHYALESDANRDVIRQHIAETLAAILAHGSTPEERKLLENHKIAKFGGDYNTSVNAVVLVGGANDLSVYFPDSLDSNLVNYLVAAGVSVYGTETSKVKYSYMPELQQQNITTVDNIDLGPGQISLILAMQGEQGDYGIKSTARRFMPSLPVEAVGR